MTFQLPQPALALLAIALSSASSSTAAMITVNLTDNALMLAQAVLPPGTTLVGTPTLSSQTGQSASLPPSILARLPKRVARPGAT